MDIKKSKSKKPMTEKQAIQIMTKRRSCIQKYRKDLTKTVKKKVKFDKPLEEVREIESNEPVLQTTEIKVKEPKTKKVKEVKAKKVKEPKVKEPKVKEPKVKKVKTKEPKETTDENQ
jgi:hypothetical protein